MKITFSGDDRTTPVVERITIDRVTIPMTVRVRACNRLFLKFDYNYMRLHRNSLFIQLLDIDLSGLQKFFVAKKVVQIYGFNIQF